MILAIECVVACVIFTAIFVGGVLWNKEAFLHEYAPEVQKRFLESNPDFVLKEKYMIFENTKKLVKQQNINGYKEIEYTEKPEYDDEEEKLVETYRVDIEETTILVCYEKVALTTEEHNQVIQYKIIEEENKITPRRQREIDLKKEGALEFAETVENNIIALRRKFR